MIIYYHAQLPYDICTTKKIVVLKSERVKNAYL